MNKKNTPPRGLMTFTIVFNYGNSFNQKTRIKGFHEKDKYSALSLQKKGRAKAIVLQSPRLIKAFTWLQNKAGSVISLIEMADALGLDSDQTRKVLHTLKSEKKIIYYEPILNGKLKLIRVDDIRRFRSKHDEE